MSTRYGRFLALLIALVVVACAGPSAPPPDPRIENLDLDIQLTAMPDGLVVTDNQGTSLELRPADEYVGGILWFAVGPEQQGVNLVAAVKEHQERIEGLPEGEYKGAQELQGPLGTAFYSRGRYVEDGAVVEETVILTIHPSNNRLLTISYRYPAGEDSAQRVEQLIDVLSYLE